MAKKLFPLISIVLIATFALAACATPTAAPTVVPATQAPAAAATEAPTTAAPATEAPTVAPAEPVALTLWTKEGETDGGLQYVQALTDAYTKLHPNVTFTVVNKEVETLREDFQTASLAGAPPDLLWTVSDHLGPFTAANLIQPVDNLFDLSVFVASATDAVKSPDGQTWGVPISNGNHLMLLYNKSLMPTPPTNTDELISMGKDFMANNPDKYALVFNQTEPFFFIPWLGGFKGKVFEADGVTPTLDTPEMISALQFVHDLKYTDGLIPPESDYDGADTLFKEGNAAMIINGDWSLSGYKDTLGDNLGVAPIPEVSATGTYPAPYTSGVFFMIPVDLSGAKLDAVKDFINFATDKENQLDMVSKLTRLPALTEALNDSMITSDPILAGSAAQMSYGIPMPTVVEMRCVWDSLKPEMQAVFADTESAADAAKNAQDATVTCISQLD
jgi:arabinogalactan oligomer/maltooligosaccharide transport system substrate-binding protein